MIILCSELSSTSGLIIKFSGVIVFQTQGSEFYHSSYSVGAEESSTQ